MNHLEELINIQKCTELLQLKIWLYVALRISIEVVGRDAYATAQCHFFFWFIQMRDNNEKSMESWDLHVRVDFRTLSRRRSSDSSNVSCGGKEDAAVPASSVRDLVNAQMMRLSIDTRDVAHTKLTLVDSNDHARATRVVRRILNLVYALGLWYSFLQRLRIENLQHWHVHPD